MSTFKTLIGILTYINLKVDIFLMSSCHRKTLIDVNNGIEKRFTTEKKIILKYSQYVGRTVWYLYASI